MVLSNVIWTFLLFYSISFVLEGEYALVSKGRELISGAVMAQSHLYIFEPAIVC